MKKSIHPELKASSIKCACGATMETRSVAGDFKVDICQSCHPFYTGRQKLVDAEGRVDRFKRKYGR